MRNEDEMAELLERHGIKSPRCGAWVGPGWTTHVDKLITELIALGWDKDLQQVKEKFGSLRFYIGTGTDEMFALISRYENMTGKMCEECGAEGKQTPNGGWVKVRCPAHTNETS